MYQTVSSDMSLLEKSCLKINCCVERGNEQGILMLDDISYVVMFFSFDKKSLNLFIYFI